MGNWFTDIFNKKSTETVLEENGSQRKIEVDWSGLNITRELARPTVADRNFIVLFQTVAEVFFPIDYISSRVASANFVLKRNSDDSVVFDNNQFNEMISRSNCLNSFQELVYSHFVYMLATGNSYFRAAVPSLLQESKLPCYKNCRNFWTLPPDSVSIIPFTRIPIFGNAEISDIIQYYQLSTGRNSIEQIPPQFILHDKDSVESYGEDFLKGKSRLESHMYCISNLIAVYEARNLIYTKQGGLGWIVSAKSDDSGTGVLTPDEKKSLRDSYESTYGLGRHQMPFGIADVPISFVRTNLSISDLQPFDETLADAVQIAGAYGIPAVLVPRKDQSTFSNQSTAEKTVYTAKVIPMAKKFAQELTTFLGYDKDGLYIDVDFSHVECLQEDHEKMEQVHKIRSERAYSEFQHGLITLNDVRARICESRVEIPLFDKLIFEMTPEEREEVKSVLAVTDGSSNNILNTVQNGRNEEPQS